MVKLLVPKLLLVSIFLSTALSAAEPIKLALDPWPPYQVVTGQSVGGFNTWVVGEVLGKMGREAEFRAYPWQRTIHMLRTNAVDGLFSIEYKKEREEFAQYPAEELSRSRWVFWTRKGSGLTIDGWEDIHGKSVGVVDGYSYTPRFWDELRKAARVERVSSDERNFLKLQHGRVDVIAAELSNGRFIARSLMLDGIVAHSRFPFKDAGLFLAFSHNTPQAFIHSFSRELKEFKRTEKYWNMRSRYFP